MLSSSLLLLLLLDRCCCRCWIVVVVAGVVLVVVVFCGSDAADAQLVVYCLLLVTITFTKTMVDNCCFLYNQ